MASWSELESTADDLAAAGRRLLMNCAPTWGIALLGTVRVDGSPRIGPLCVYLLGDGVYVTLEGWKENDLQRDARYFLHSYWGDGQDEFALAGEAGRPLAPEERGRLVDLAPRIARSSVIRELQISSAHAVTYRNFPRADMYAEVIGWRDGESVRRWTRSDPAPPEDDSVNVS
jgi:hypothetical protein